MALPAGTMIVTLDFASELKDVQWFGRQVRSLYCFLPYLRSLTRPLMPSQDPYCKLKIGNQEFRSKTATDGGKSPVWDQTFRCGDGHSHGLASMGLMHGLQCMGLLAWG